MHAPGQVERLWTRRLRWRMRGAWQWPAFAVLTAVDAVLLTKLPFYSGGPDTLAGGALLAGFANLLIVAVVAPAIGRWGLRRRRPDLPRLVASDYAGAGALATLTLLLVAGGLLHRPAVAAERAEASAVVASTAGFVMGSAPEYRTGLARIDAIRLEAHLYRSCVPGADPRRWLCVFVKTSQSPPGVVRDPDETPNSAYRANPGPR